MHTDDDDFTFALPYNPFAYLRDLSIDLNLPLDVGKLPPAAVRNLLPGRVRDQEPHRVLVCPSARRRTGIAHAYRYGYYGTPGLPYRIRQGRARAGGERCERCGLSGVGKRRSRGYA